MSKQKLSFSFNSLLFFSLCIFSHPLYFSLLFCLLSLMQLFKTIPSPHTLGLHFFFPSTQMAEWPLPLFLHLFLLFSVSHSSHQVTINASQLILTLLQPISFLQLSHTRMTLAFCFFLFFLLSACPTRLSQPTPITHANFCT